MRFEEFIARPALLSHLRATFGAGRVYHAYLFEGPRGTGKRTMARICAQSLFCTAEAGNRPCGRCSGCLSFSEGHPDLITLSVPADKTVISVEAVREMLSAIGDRTFSGGMRAVIIEEADHMNRYSQNAILKTLEEPPEDTVFILCVQNAASLPPTIASRCQRIRFAPVDEELLFEKLKERGASDENAAWIVKFSGGAPGRAISCLSDEKLRKLYTDIRTAWECITGGKGVANAVSAMSVAKDQYDDALDCFEAIGRMLLERNEKGGIALLQAVMEARRMLKSNVTWQYASERMLMRAAEDIK